MDDRPSLPGREVTAPGDIRTAGFSSNLALLTDVDSPALRTALMLPYIPPEVLYLVFKFLSFWSLISASTVNRAWRTAIVNDPRLWTVIYTESVCGLREYLRRGSSHPVSISTRFRDCTDDLSSLVSEHLQRMERLSIGARDHVVGDLLSSGVLDAGLAQPAYRLKYFDMLAGWSKTDDIFFNACFFAGKAPALEELWLLIPCQPVLHAFPRLSTVALLHSKLQDFNLVWHVLLSCPRLEQAVLHVNLGLSEHSLFTGTKPLLPTLRRLQLAIRGEEDDVTMDDGERLLEILRPEVRSQIDLTLTPVVAPNDMPSGADTLSITRETHFRGLQPYCVLAFGGGRPRRCFREVSLEHARYFLQQQLALSDHRLLELTVPASLLMHVPDPGSASFLRLHTFTVAVPASELDFICAVDGLRLHLARMPVLRTLVLRAETDGVSWVPQEASVDPDMLMYCLNVRGADTPIERVVLQGVETDLTSADVQPNVGELVREPWKEIEDTADDDMTLWLLDL